jgi:amino acid adenylation domain-containing protein
MKDHSIPLTNLPPEQEAIRAKCFHPSGRFEEFSIEDVEQSIPRHFEKIARLYPHRIAVKTRKRALTYDDLNQAANRVAHSIIERRGEANEPIALLLENDAPMIAAILGALKAGKMYVPLDASYPRASLAYILDDSAARVVVTNTENLHLARELAHSGLELVNLDDIDGNSPAPNPDLTISPESLVYILYTSGSTGKPKGVVHNHRNVLHEIMNYTDAVHIGVDDRLALLSSPSFADAVRTTYGALLNGAGLYPLNIRAEGLARLGDWLIEQEITIYRSVPAVFRQFAGALTGNENFPRLRAIYSAGDTVSKHDIDLYKKHFSPHCIFVNGLGASECLTFCWQFFDKQTRISHSTVPVGHAIEDMEILLLDEDGNRVGFDQVGEMVVKSRYLSPGYWRKPELTAAAFSDAKGASERTYRTGDLGRMSSDGCLEHLGRKDFQVKIRGYRIEVIEIETALLGLETIKAAVVVARENGSGNPSTGLPSINSGPDPSTGSGLKAVEGACPEAPRRVEGRTDLRLVAYLVPHERPGPAVHSLRRALEERLPDYMIPAAFVLLDALPLTPNGKVDRRSLPAPDSTRPELENPFVAPRSPIEEALANIWSQVLGLERVGAHDNFFDLGGHSLLATQVISRVRDLYRIEISLRSFFETPTVAQIADAIQRAKDSDAENPAPKIFPVSRQSHRVKAPL